MQPAQLLDMQMDLVYRLDDLRFRNMVQELMQQALNANEQDERTAFGKQAIEVFDTTVRNAYCYRVTPDMCDVVFGLSQQLTDDDVYRCDMAPTDWGMVRFERPLDLTDVRGKHMKIHWAIWGPASLQHTHERGKLPPLRGTGVWFWNDDNEPDQVALEMIEKDPEYHKILRETSGRWNWIGFSVFTDGGTMGPPSIAPKDDWTEYQLRQMEYSINVSKLDDEEVHFEDFKPITNVRRYMHALWVLLNQTLVTVEEEPLERAVKRRAKRMNIPARVTVIKMRRIEDPHRYEGDSMVEWHHRWPVRGHLAWRKCGEDLPGAEPYEKGFRRRIWIPAYWKGPEDAPVMITEKVFDLSR